jgi:hypothetical protein
MRIRLSKGDATTDAEVTCAAINRAVALVNALLTR